MKTLNESISEIINSRSSKLEKKIAIIKLGVREKEANFLLNMSGTISNREKRFNASLLTFGVEIECFNVRQSDLIAGLRNKRVECHSEHYNHSDNKQYFKLVSDASIQGNDPVECVSPILKGAVGMKSLEATCNTLCEINAKVNKSTGLHVHFDASKLSDECYCNILKNYQRIEAAIDSFMPVSRRDSNNIYCISLKGLRLDRYETKNDMINAFCSRYYKVNTQAYLRHKTIEFRQHSGTVDFVKISNWILFLRKLISYSYTNKIQNDIERIEDIPFLTASEKEYFINRRNILN